jgi:DMSO/TMAO reductase YedYZ molybdopterin-dependent catalytic subunit
MGKRFFKTSLLVITLELLLFSFLGGVGGVEVSGATNDAAASDSEWRLLVDGAVYQPLNLTLSELATMPTTTVNANLYCYSSLVTAGNWTGVRLQVVLEEAELHDGATGVIFLASDGYATALEMSTAMQEDVILAYELNDQPLPEVLRLVLPGRNGDKWIAMITHINVSTVPVPASDPRALRPPELPLPSTTPQPMHTPQPDNQSVTTSVIPSSPQSENSSIQQEFPSSNLQMEYNYAILTVMMLVIAVATGYLYLKHKKIKR